MALAPTPALPGPTAGAESGKPLVFMVKTGMVVYALYSCPTRVANELYGLSLTGGPAQKM
jgi:hypothetical protein